MSFGQLQSKYKLQAAYMLEGMAGKFPCDFRELLKCNGVGPKVARRAFRKLVIVDQKDGEYLISNIP